MNAHSAAAALLRAVHEGDDLTVHRILNRRDLPKVTVELAQIAPRPPRQLVACGTHSAYTRHKARGETIDAACRDAERIYHRDRARLRRQRDKEHRLAPAGSSTPERDIDLVAVRRAAAGDAVALTRHERREAVRLLHARGHSYNQIADRLGTHRRMVHRDLKVLGLGSQLVGVSADDPTVTPIPLPIPGQAGTVEEEVGVA